MIDFIAWVEVNKVRLLQAVFVALVAGFIVYTWSHMRQKAEREASEALIALGRSAEAGGKVDAEKFLAVSSTHSGTEAGLRALLLGAGALFSEKKFDLARARFEQFLAEVPIGPGAATAAYGVAASLEGANKLDEALQGYQRVVVSYSTEPEAAQAQLAMALLHEAKKQDDQALKIYDEIDRARRQSVWGMEAKMRRDLLLARNPQLAPASLIVPPAPGPKAAITNLPAFTNTVTTVVTNPPKSALPQSPAKGAGK